MVPEEINFVKEYTLPDLHDVGYDVSLMKNPKGLIERINSWNPDALILGIKFEEYNGLDLLQDVRHEFENLPTILHTAYDTFKENMKSIAADFYILRSHDSSELLQKLDMVLAI